MTKVKHEFSTKRIRCPKCGKKAFAPFVGAEGGYCHFCNSTDKSTRSLVSASIVQDHKIEKQFLDMKLWEMLLLAESSRFVKHFSILFGSRFEMHCKNHFCIRADKFGNTVFPYWNYQGKLINAKTIAYDNSGHRKKDYPPLFGINIRDENGNLSFKPLSRKNGYTQCLFNEHALNPFISNRLFDYDIKFDSTTPVILVEAEKSAVIASYFIPEYVWVACGGVSGLTEEKSKYLQGRNIKIFFDNEEFAQQRAEKVATGLKAKGIDAGVTNPFNIMDYPKGYDIADYLVDFYSGREK